MTFSHVFDRRILRALPFVCKTFTGPAQESLYRHVEVKPDCLLELTRTLLANARLALVVRSVTLLDSHLLQQRPSGPLDEDMLVDIRQAVEASGVPLGFGGAIWLTDLARGSSGALFALMLTLLENLEGISDETLSWATDGQSFDEAVVEAALSTRPARKFEKLKVISTASSHPSHLGLATWARIPSVVDIRIGPSGCGLSRTLAEALKRPGIEALKMHSSVYNRADTHNMICILSASNSITKLSNTDVRDEGGTWLNLKTSIALRKRSLTHLELIRHSKQSSAIRNIARASVDYRLDLAGFDCIRQVSIDMRLLLYIDNRHHDQHLLLPRRLPHSLETLEMWHCRFDDEPSAFSRRSSVQKKNLKWNLESFVEAAEAGEFPHFHHFHHFHLHFGKCPVNYCLESSYLSTLKARLSKSDIRLTHFQENLEDFSPPR